MKQVALELNTAVDSFENAATRHRCKTHKRGLPEGSPLLWEFLKAYALNLD